MSGVSLSLEYWTPEKARDQLARNNHNRKVSANRVREYRDQMAAGLWQANPVDSIAIAEDGRLINGQHRLMALAESNVSIALWVARGVPVEMFAVIDQGKKRSVADVAYTTGAVAKNHVVTVAAASWLVRYERQQITSPTSTQHVPSHATMAFIARHPRMALAEYPSSLFKAAELGLTSVRISAWYLAAVGLGERRAADFFDGLVSGAGLAADDSRLVLRNRLLSNATLRRKAGSAEMFYWLCRALANYANARPTTPSAMRWRTEGRAIDEFPDVPGVNRPIQPLPMVSL